MSPPVENPRSPLPVVQVVPGIWVGEENPCVVIFWPHCAASFPPHAQSVPSVLVARTPSESPPRLTSLQVVSVPTWVGDDSCKLSTWLSPKIPLWFFPHDQSVPLVLMAITCRPFPELVANLAQVVSVPTCFGEEDPTTEDWFCPNGLPVCPAPHDQSVPSVLTATFHISAHVM